MQELGDGRGRREWVLCELLAGHSCLQVGSRGRFGIVKVYLERERAWDVFGGEKRSWLRTAE